MSDRRGRPRGRGKSNPWAKAAGQSKHGGRSRGRERGRSPDTIPEGLGEPEFDKPWVRLHFPPPHPLIWRKTVIDRSPDARPGELVHVYDKDGARIGAGLYAPRSHHVLRMLRRDGEAWSEDWLRDTLDEAIALRRELFRLDDRSEAWRVVHAEGDGLPGLMIDRYGPLLSIELFTEGWIGLLPILIEHLHERLGTESAIVQADRRALETERFKDPGRRFGAVPDTLEVREDGIRFLIDPSGGHKTGFFCDQRENRKRLAGLCEGRRVLDTCTYTGGFALAAATGGASEVTAVDLDESAVAMAKRNADLNQQRIKVLQADAFHYLRQMESNGEQWDVLVLDPPKFIPDRKSEELGRRKYVDLNRLALPLVKPGGLLVSCSCSGLVSPGELTAILAEASRKGDHGRSVQIFDMTGAGPDHPVRADCPESGYLKVAWCRVL